MRSEEGELSEKQNWLPQLQRNDSPENNSERGKKIETTSSSAIYPIRTTKAKEEGRKGPDLSLDLSEKEEEARPLPSPSFLLPPKINYRAARYE